MKQKGLSRIEKLAEELVEGTFGRLFGGRLESQDVANQLARAIEDNEQDGQMPMVYNVALNPYDLRLLIEDTPDLADVLAVAAKRFGQQAGVTGAGMPLVELTADPKLKRQRIRITAQTDTISQTDNDEMTRAYSHTNLKDNPLQTLQMLDAFLIVQGRRHIPLTRPVITVGRRPDNDIVLDLPSVSRQHAQLRWRFEKFILFDVSSRGSTLVNGHPIHEQLLRPGDVITLGDALLVYGEGPEEFFHKRSTDGGDDTVARSA